MTPTGGQPAEGPKELQSHNFAPPTDIQPKNIQHMVDQAKLVSQAYFTSPALQTSGEEHDFTLPEKAAEQAAKKVRNWAGQ